MTEVAGLAIGVAALWKTCVQVFDVVESGRRYGMDYELLRVKLEVERMRLFNWGEAIGLSDNDAPGENDTVAGAAGGSAVDPARVLFTGRPDARLQKEDMNRTVIRLLGCIEHLFEDSEQLQNAYGLRPATPLVAAQDVVSTTLAGASLGRFILGAVFKKSYEALKRNARERQSTTTMARRTMWAIHDKKKFQAMVAEIRGFNDSLQSLFPESRDKIVEVMRTNVEASASINELQLLQEATSEDHADISDVATARLEELGAPSTARTDLLSEQLDALALVATEEEIDNDAELVERIDDLEGAAAVTIDPAVAVFEKRRNKIKVFFEKKRHGALSLEVDGPYQYSARVTTNCYWSGKEPGRWWDDRGKGYKTLTHSAFDAYHKKRYTKRTKEERYERRSEEDSVIFDVESYPKYENVNPGTITVDGFGLEAWDFEESMNARPSTVVIDVSDPPDIPARKLLRRIDEMQRHMEKLGWNPEREVADLKEFTGNMGQTYTNSAYEYEHFAKLSNLFRFLNRSDIFDNFLSASSVGSLWNNPREKANGFWNLLWQIIVSKELIRRLEAKDGSRYTVGFTEKILASIIVADLWLKNIEIVLKDKRISPKDIKPPETDELKAKAENYKKQGNDALAKKEYNKALELYTEAIRIDPSCAVYRANRSAALYSLQRYEESVGDAHMALRLDAKYAKAWSRYGLAAVKTDRTKKAIEAYENAILLAGKDATPSMRKGLEDAMAANKAKIKAINDEKDKRKKDMLRKELIDQDYDTRLKTVEIHSLCHEQQVEGLIHFAERMKWPWVNDVRDYAEEAYSNLRGGQFTPIDLHDWLYGMMLPGQWFSFKIMSALIICTPSLKNQMTGDGIAPYFECGLSLPKKSYWRIRTVLGRVLGSLPGVTSLCGWLGPCPPVEFIKTSHDDDDNDLDGSEPRHVKLKARRVTLVEYKPWNDDGAIVIGNSHNKHEDTRLGENEEMAPWMAEMQDPNNWIVPEPPVRQVGSCVLTKIQLKLDLSERSATTDPDATAVYRAQLTFTLDDSPSQPVTYKLHTNPVFVTPPPCSPGPRGAQHDVHLRELHRYQERNIWTFERLKDHSAGDDPAPGSVMVINATGQGAETLARAWCSERGKNAVIRRTGGPCFYCAERAASPSGLGTGVLIWVS